MLVHKRLVAYIAVCAWLATPLCAQPNARGARPEQTVPFEHWAYDACQQLSDRSRRTSSGQPASCSKVAFTPRSCGGRNLTKEADSSGSSSRPWCPGTAGAGWRKAREVPQEIVIGTYTCQNVGYAARERMVQMYRTLMLVVLVLVVAAAVVVIAGCPPKPVPPPAGPMGGPGGAGGPGMAPPPPPPATPAGEPGKAPGAPAGEPGKAPGAPGKDAGAPAVPGGAPGAPDAAAPAAPGGAPAMPPPPPAPKP